MSNDEGMMTKKEPAEGWPVTIAFCVTILCATAIALALILS
jgi:hypothetical protein